MNTLLTQATTRTKAVQVVATIASDKNYQIWSRVYNRLQLSHNINLSGYLRQGGESLLSVAERYGYLEQVYQAVLTEWLFSQTAAA